MVKHFVGAKVCKDYTYYFATRFVVLVVDVLQKLCQSPQKKNT